MKDDVSRVLHYLVEVVAIITITFLAVSYMSVGGYEQPIILGAIAAITGIAAYDIRKREQKE